MVTQTKKKLPSYSLYDIRNLDDLRDSVLSSKDEFVAIDTETTGLNWNKDRAFGVSIAWDNKGIFIRNTDYGVENIGNVMNTIFSSTDKTFVYHNAEFDLHMMRETYGTKIPRHILDTQRLSHLHDPRPPHGLKDLGEELFGAVAGAAEDTIKSYMKQYNIKGYHQVPPEFMDPYAVLDTVLTKALAYHFIGDIRKSCDFLCNIEHGLIPILLKMEEEGLRVNTEYVNQLLKEYRVEQRFIQDEIYNIVGKPIEVASTKQLQEYFYDRLKIVPPAETATGQRSVNKKTLEKIDHPIGTKVAELILRWRDLDKNASTFLEPYKDLEGRVHPHWNATGTRTGRFSSSGPNLQNVPKDDKIRRIFVPDNEFFDFDFSQVELRLMAHVSDQKNMIEAFKNNEDLHSMTASLIFGKTMDEVSAKERQVGKRLNFGVVYGAGTNGLIEHFDFTRTQAGNLLNSFHSVYPQIRSKTSEYDREGQKNGYVKTLFGRKLPVDPDKTYRSANYVVQGTAGDVIKIAIYRTAKYIDSIGGKIRNTVHDEILFDDIEESHISDIRECMEGFNFVVPIKADLQRSKVSWGDLINE